MSSSRSIICLYIFFLIILLFISNNILCKSSNDYHDCTSCVKAGYGWSKELNQCGSNYKNHVCKNNDEKHDLDEDEEMAIDNDDDDDDDEDDDDNDKQNHINNNKDDEEEDDDDEDNEDNNNKSNNNNNNNNNEDNDEDIEIDNDYDNNDDFNSPRTYSWADTELTTHLWTLISRGNLNDLSMLIERQPTVINERSADGRGALFWAYEYDQPHLVDLLLANGADENAKDRNGNSPRDLAGRAPH